MIATSKGKRALGGFAIHCEDIERFQELSSRIFFQDVFDKDVFQNDFMGSVPLTVDDVKEAAKVHLFLQFILFPKYF